jgi:hypothetical protein
LLGRLQAEYLDKHFSQEFNNFFREVFPVQLQVCYAELLKDKNHQPAWIAYQKMLLEETRQGVSAILERQDKSGERHRRTAVSKMAEKISRLSPRKTAGLKELPGRNEPPAGIGIVFQ